MADKMTGLGALGQQLIRQPSRSMMVDTTTGEGANMFIEEDRRRMGPAGPAGRDDENFTILDPSFDIQIMTHSGVGAPPLLTEMGGKYYVIQDGAFIPFNSREEAEKYIRQVAPFNKGGRVGLRFGTPEEGIGSLNAGAPDITYEGSEGPKAPMQMAGPDRYQKILEFKINELEGELGRELTDEEYEAVSKEAYEEYNYGAGGQPLPQDPTKPINPFQPKPKGIQMAAKGGRIGYRMGTGPAGLPGIPRMAPDGMEFDMRQNGGFQGLGAKEGKDDVPAMLAKNEFVFTADAVRGAGGGDIELGAQKMYDTMKNLERRVV